VVVGSSGSVEVVEPALCDCEGAASVDVVEPRTVVVVVVDEVVEPADVLPVVVVDAVVVLAAVVLLLEVVLIDTAPSS
jgi:hypothetical protein